jgi:hypothetical protein
MGGMVQKNSDWFHLFLRGLNIFGLFCAVITVVLALVSFIIALATVFRGPLVIIGAIGVIWLCWKAYQRGLFMFNF